METSMVSAEAVPNSTGMNNFLTTSSGHQNPTEPDMATIGTTTTRGDGRNFRFDDETQRIIIGSFYCLVAVASFVGNVLVILAVILSKKLQTRTNAFVVNLATADLMSSISSPFLAVAFFSMNGWPLPGLVCSVSAAIYYISLACSVMNLTTIAINRYVLITKPMQTYQSIYTPKKIAAMMVLTWLYPVLVCSTFPLFGIGKWGYSEQYRTCTQDTSSETSGLFSLLGSALIYPIPLIILFVCYFKIYRHVTGHMNKMLEKGMEMPDSPTASTSSTKRLRRRSTVNISKRQVEITKNLFYVMCTFIVCLTPFAVALMIPSGEPAIPWAATFVVFNSAVNPVIYGVKHPHFKEVFRHMLRCRYHMIPEPSSCLRKMSSK